MALIVTPGRLSQLAEFYHQVSTMTAAGLGVLQALEHLHRSPPARSFRKPIRGVLDDLGHGSTLTDAIRNQPGWLPSFDVALLEAGETSGRLDACFGLLDGYYRERADLARKLIAELAYPVFLLNFAVLSGPFLGWMFGAVSTNTLLLITLGGLGPFYAGVLLLIYACQGRHGENWRALVEKVTHTIPMVGSARRKLALARLAISLEALLNAGVPIVHAWELAATASGSPALRRLVVSWAPQLESGSTPAELLRNSPQFPDVFTNLYSTGEISGTLDDTLRRLHRLYQDEGSRKLAAAVKWTPKLVFILVAIGIAFKVLSFYGNYFKQVNQFIN